MAWTDKLEEYQNLAETVEPVAVVQTKDHWLWTALWWAATVATLGLFALGQSKTRFLEDFATTVGPRQGYPKTWASLQKETIIHESRHTTQAVWCGRILVLGWFNRRLAAWVGLPLNTLVYALLPVPVFLAAGRFFLEQGADRRAWLQGLREGWLSEGDVRWAADRRAHLLSSGAYVWAWPKSWALKSYRALADDLVAKVNTERLKQGVGVL